MAPVLDLCLVGSVGASVLHLVVDYDIGNSLFNANSGPPHSLDSLTSNRSKCASDTSPRRLRLRQLEIQPTLRRLAPASTRLPVQLCSHHVKHSQQAASLHRLLLGKRDDFAARRTRSHSLRVTFAHDWHAHPDRAAGFRHQPQVHIPH